MTTTAKTPMLKVGAWHVRFPAGQVEALVLDQENARVATVSGPNADEIMRRALLLAAAPDLRDCALACLQAFDAQTQASTDATARAAARDMLKPLVAALTAAGVEVTRRGKAPRK